MQSVRYQPAVHGLYMVEHQYSTLDNRHWYHMAANIATSAVL